MAGKPGSGRKPSNRVGEVFGKLSLINYEGDGKWLCECECGNQKIIRSSKLRSGNTRSCGCLRREIIRERNTTHLETKHYLHRLWSGIKTRCYNENNSRWQHYGGRGITMCEEWRDDYLAFRDYILKNLGDKPSPDYSLDRIDNDGDYTPGNLRWADYETQNNNRSEFGTH